MKSLLFLTTVSALEPMAPCEKLPDGLLPPLKRVNTPYGDVKKGLEYFVREVPEQLREMFKISHFKVDTKKH
jgi:hypothetical protein